MSSRCELIVFARRESVADRKSIAIALGVAVGVASVAAALAVYSSRHREPAARDINEVFDQARQTVRKLDEALEMLRRSVPAA